MIFFRLKDKWIKGFSGVIHHFKRIINSIAILRRPLIVIKTVTGGVL